MADKTDLFIYCLSPSFPFLLSSLSKCLCKSGSMVCRVAQGCYPHKFTVQGELYMKCVKKVAPEVGKSFLEEAEPQPCH